MILESEEELLLDEINQYLPKNIDWKSGACTYLNELIQKGGESYRSWHYTKPFIAQPLLGAPLHDDSSQTGVDKYVLWNELYPILNILKKVDLLPHSNVLDIACGPGWISHFIGKMGHSVLGVDISEEMLKIARERIESEPFPPYPLKKLNVKFLMHDLEESPIPTTELFDLILIDSALHHFYNPIRALKNISTHLAPSGILAIIEAIIPGGPPGPIEMAIMEKYHTLERPYTYQQLSQVLALSGFPKYLFLESVNCLREYEFNSNPILTLKSDYGFVLITSKDNDRLIRLSPSLDSSRKNIEWLNFHDEEKTNDGNPYRWSPTESGMKITGYTNICLNLSSIYPPMTQQKQNISVNINGKEEYFFELKPGNNEKIIEIKDLKNPTHIEFYSDSAIYPFMHKLNDDGRQLAFMIKVVSHTD